MCRNDTQQPNPRPTAADAVEATIVQAWQEQLAQAAKTPVLAATLLRQSRALYDRLVAVYRELLALSRQRRRKLLRTLGTSLAGAALLVALGSTPAAWAASITVDGSCTLVDAITAANTDTATGGCAAGSGADTITLTGDVTLTSANNGDNGLPLIRSAVTIEGDGHTIARAASAPAFRIFDVESPGNLTLNATTIMGGALVGQNTGGAIRNNYGTVVTVSLHGKDERGAHLELG